MAMDDAEDAYKFALASRDDVAIDVAWVAFWTAEKTYEAELLKEKK